MRQLALELSARPEPAFDNFLPGRNAEALAALIALARGEGNERFIYLWGKGGSGRSHLLEAVVREAGAAGRPAIRVSAPLAHHSLAAMGADQVVAVDAVERLDAAGQRALFGLYNRIREGSGALVASGPVAPTALGVRADLATRLAWGLVYEVHALSDEDKAAAMRARATALGFALPAEVQAYALRHGRRDLPSLLALVDRLDRYSLETHRAVTLPLVREVLRAGREHDGAGVMRLVLFDLDNTLLAGDSDYEWAQFLIEEGVLEREVYEARNREFFEQYKAGSLDIREFLDFQLRPLSQYSREVLDRWHHAFMQRKITPMISPAARALVAKHRDDLCVIITATNSFVTAPIAREFGIEHLVATIAEERDGRFTGAVSGLPCFREGKVTRLQDWLARRELDLGDFSETWFYSDSANDLPLLERVTHPVAVDPDPRLEAHAGALGWPILRLHGPEPAR